MAIIKPALILLLTSSLALALSVPGPASAEDVYKKMANDFARYSVNKKVKNVAVISFARKARTSREESEYFSEKLLACLVESGKVNMVERSQLDKVLEERRLAAAGVTQETQESSGSKINPSDAIIVGTIFGTRDHLKIIAKMVDPLTGEVMHTVQAQTARQWEIIPERIDFEFEMPDMSVIAAMFEEATAAAPRFPDFRDAPSGLSTESCNARRTRLAGMQEAALEAKAKYWALQMRDPDFDSAKLRRNPGGEIKIQADKNKFYAMLDAFYKAPAAPRLSAGEMNTVISVMEEEEKVSDECGLH